MAKEELIEMMGIATEMLPDSRYRVTLDNGHELIAYTGRLIARSDNWPVDSQRGGLHQPA